MFSQNAYNTSDHSTRNWYVLTLLKQNKNRTKKKNMERRTDASLFHRKNHPDQSPPSHLFHFSQLRLLPLLAREQVRFTVARRSRLGSKPVINNKNECRRCQQTKIGRILQRVGDGPVGVGEGVSTHAQKTPTSNK